MIRIIAGKHRGRKLEVPATGQVRPTSERTREAVFNILCHFAYGEKSNVVDEATVLDLFSGSGAMGFEALSRGAAHVTFVDSDNESIKFTSKNAAKIGELDNASFLRMDASSLGEAKKKYSLVFLDPPYEKGLVSKSLESLTTNGWLEEGAVIIAEHSEREKIAVPSNLKVLDERKYGIATVTILSL